MVSSRPMKDAICGGLCILCMYECIYDSIWYGLTVRNTCKLNAMVTIIIMIYHQGLGL